MAISPRSLANRRSLAGAIGAGIIAPNDRLLPPLNFRFAVFNGKPVRFGGKLVIGKVA